MSLTVIIIIAFIIWLNSIWIAVLSLLSFISGWNKLGRLYPLEFSDRKNITSNFSMCSIKLGSVNYRSCVTISFSETGIILEMLKIFNIKHKPLLIPYNKISDAETGKSFTTYTRFNAGMKKIVIYGKPGDELFSRLNSPAATD